MPREVFCDLCGGKFFPHSLPHHRKSCQKKVQAQMIECPYCNMGMLRKAAGAKPTGQSAQLRQRLLSDGPRASISKERRGTATTASGRLISQTGSQGAPGRETPPQSQEKKIPGTGATAYSGTSPEAAVLVPCQVCGRTFNMDRIAKHQAVCLKLRKKRPVFQAQKQRLFMEGGSTGTVVGSAVAAPRKARRPGAPQSQPLNSHWREESKSFRQAIRAARGAPPMPRWGGGFGDARRGAPTASRHAQWSSTKKQPITYQTCGVERHRTGGARRMSRKVPLTEANLRSLSESEDEKEPQEEEKSPPIMMILQLCCISAIEGMDAGLLPAVNYALQKDLGLRLTDLSVLTLAQAVAQALAAPIWGVLADRRVVRRKTLLCVGALFQGSSTVMLSWTNGFAFMLVLRIINGAMLASLKPLAIGLVADTTSETNRGKIYGYIQMCVTLGMMAVAMIGTPMSHATILTFQGWRVAFVMIGSFPIFTAFLIKVFMHEARREKTWEPGSKRRGCDGAKEEMRKLGSYFTKPTFLCLVGQGLFGAIPWNAFNYSTMYFQINGLSDTESAALSTMFQLACAIGNVLGGIIGDRMAKRCPNHGRAFTANISVTCGIPCVFLIFMSTHQSFVYYAALLVLMGVSSTWCGVGVNWPILSEILGACK
eukprot:symbB.v1.2.024810.t1/scaffold2358.1/size81431/1